MPESPTPQTSLEYEHPVTLGVLAAFLRGGRIIDHASSILLLGILFLLTVKAPVWPGLLLPTLAIALALAEKYHAWRVALDAELFAVLLAHPAESAQFDCALAVFLGRSHTVTDRSMHSRWQGARRLLCRQAACLGLQLCVTLFALF